MVLGSGQNGNSARKLYQSIYNSSSLTEGGKDKGACCCKQRLLRISLMFLVIFCAIILGGVIFLSATGGMVTPALGVIFTIAGVGMLASVVSTLYLLSTMDHPLPPDLPKVEGGKKKKPFVGYFDDRMAGFLTFDTDEEARALVSIISDLPLFDEGFEVSTEHVQVATFPYDILDEQERALTLNKVALYLDALADINYVSYQDVPGDGNCFFYAAQQTGMLVGLFNNEESPVPELVDLRQNCADWLLQEYKTNPLAYQALIEDILTSLDKVQNLTLSEEERKKVDRVVELFQNELTSPDNQLISHHRADMNFCIISEETAERVSSRRVLEILIESYLNQVGQNNHYVGVAFALAFSELYKVPIALYFSEGIIPPSELLVDLHKSQKENNEEEADRIKEELLKLPEQSQGKNLKVVEKDGVSLITGLKPMRTFGANYSNKPPLTIASVCGTHFITMLTDFTLPQ